MLLVAKIHLCQLRVLTPYLSLFSQSEGREES